MGKTVSRVKGMDAILPDQTPAWQYLESCVRQILESYGYQEFRLPIVERTELFKRSIGEVTDIVEKEMYTFEDLNGDSLSLRPEGTAGCVRAAIDKGLLHNQQQRLWYNGPMFRHEKPQEGRYRQFFQIGIEAFGYADIDIEFEHLLICNRLWKKLGFEDVALEINTLGTSEERKSYRDRLVAYFSERQDQLDEDSQRRLTTNPLRILDTKNPDMQDLVEAAPKLMEHLGDESRAKFESLTTLLDGAGIDYKINTRLVRGLDYYSHTVYEWTTDKLGAQGTICAGGRFDGLVSQLGGRENHAVGFAMGLDRIVLLLNRLDLVPQADRPHVYLVAMGEQAQAKGFEVSEALRGEYPDLRLVINCGGGSFKSQFKKADKSGAEVALLFGEDELAAGQVTLKYLREEGKQLRIDLPEVSSYIGKLLANREN